MQIGTYNKSLCEYCKKSLKTAFIFEIDPQYQDIIYCNDTDSVQYKIITRKNKFTLYFFFVDLVNVWSYIEKYFRAVYYQKFTINITKINNQSALEISLEPEGFTALNQIMQINNQAEGISGAKKYNPFVEALGKRLASIKRHFLASPFEMMLEAVKLNSEKKDSATLSNFTFYMKPNKKQKIWLAFEQTQFTVYYGVSFEDRFEQQLGKIYFSELVDAKKQVHNAPAILTSENQFPKALITNFPNEKNENYMFTNGIIALTFFGNLVKNHRGMASNLANFRNYAYYHIQSWKCYLHSRILRRLAIIQKDFEQAQINGH